MRIKIELPSIMYYNNIGAIYLTHNAKLLQREKDIYVKYHFVREYVENDLVKKVFVRLEENDTDIWTNKV